MSEAISPLSPSSPGGPTGPGGPEKYKTFINELSYLNAITKTTHVNI